MIGLDNKGLTTPGRPFTIDARTPTVRELQQVLTTLLELGFGDTVLVRADSAAGFTDLTTIEYYDVAEEYKKGSASARRILLIC